MMQVKHVSCKPHMAAVDQSQQPQGSCNYTWHAATLAQSLARMLTLPQDCWNRPISSAPDSWIDVMERTDIGHSRFV